MTGADGGSEHPATGVVDGPASDTPADRAVLADASLDKGDAPTPADGAAERPPSNSCSITAIAAGDDHTCALDSTGAVTCWGLIQPFTSIFPAALPPTTVAGIPAARQVAAGGLETCIIDTAGAITCWAGGAAPTQALPALEKLPPGETPLALQVGTFAACARTTGLTECWGSGTDGQFGDGTTSSDIRTTPGPVDDTDGVSRAPASLAVGGVAACAIRASDQSTWCWGGSGEGEIGNDHLLSSSFPIPVVGLGAMSEVVVGKAHACARDAAGTVYCWGGDTHNELGDGALWNRALPGVVGGLPPGVVHLASSAGASHTCALMPDASVRCWGSNMYGQLGGDGFAGSPPTLAMTGVRQVAPGARHTCALKLDGTVWCWGTNFYGQLGSGDLIYSAPARQVALPCAGTPPALPDDGSPRDAGHPDAVSVRDASDGPAPLPGGPWTDRTPSPLPFDFPSLRSGANLTFDRARGRVVLMSGSAIGNNDGAQQIWEWDGGPTWTNRTPTHHPLAWPQLMFTPAMVFDEARNRVIVRGTDLRAWEWDGSGAWGDSTPLPLPASWLPAQHLAAAYDVARAKMVAYDWDQRRLWEGDLVNNQWTSWQLNGGSSSAPGTQPGSPVALVYDHRRNVEVMMFHSTPGFEVWDWNGTTWRNRTTIDPQLSDFTAVYDDVRGVVTLIDRGNLVMPDAGSVWEWNGDAGTFTSRAARATAPVWPPMRVAHVATYDSVRHKTISYGWDGNATTVGDCWEWDSAAASWTDRTPPPSVEQWLDTGQGAVMVSDAHRNRVLAFSGALGDIYNSGSHDLYEWDPAVDRWILRTPTPRPAAWPPDRYSFAATVDSDRDRLVLFGGNVRVGGSAEMRADLWEMDLATYSWTDRTPVTLPTAWPAPHSEHAMAYDSARHRVVLIGGNAPGFLGPTSQSDLWEWDGAAGTWTNRVPESAPVWPTGRLDATMVYDAARARMIVFGGRESIFSATALAELWEWDGAAGVFVNASANPHSPTWPVARYGHAATFDPGRGRMIVFGGDTRQAANDTWEWDGAAGIWTQRATRTVRPRARAGAGMAFDVARGRAVLAGGALGYADVGTDTWEYDGSQSD